MPTVCSQTPLSYICTEDLGMRLTMHALYIYGSVISLQWDTAAQERFLSLSDSIYRKVDGIFIAYDITEEVRTITDKSCAVAIVKAYHKSPRTLCH